MFSVAFECELINVSDNNFIATCSSGCLSVTLVDCNHMQQEGKSAHDRIYRCLGYLYAKAEPNSIRAGYGECRVLHFGGNNLRNGASYELDEKNSNRKSHRRIE